MLTCDKIGENQHLDEGRCSLASERWDEALETYITLSRRSRQDLVHTKGNETDPYSEVSCAFSFVLPRQGLCLDKKVAAVRPRLPHPT